MPSSAKKKAKAATKARRYEWQCWSPFAPKPAPATSSEDKDTNNSDCESMPPLEEIESSSDEDMDEVFERSGAADEANEFDTSDDDDDAANIQGLCAETDRLDCTKPVQVEMLRDAVARQKQICDELSRSSKLVGVASEVKELSDVANSNGAEGLAPEEHAQVQSVLLESLQEPADLESVAAVLSMPDSTAANSTFDRFASAMPHSREQPKQCDCFLTMEEAEMAKSVFAANSRPMFAVQSGNSDPLKARTWMCANTVRLYPKWSERRDAFRDQTCCRAVFQTQTVSVKALRKGRWRKTELSRIVQHERAAQTMYGLWQQHSKGKMTCDASQPAAGSYTEMGVGVLPGVGRRSLIIDGVSTNVPFPRNAALSDLIEPNLGDFMSDVSEVVHHVLSSANAHPVALHVRQHGPAARAYQYPRLRREASYLSSHQVVIRGPRFNPAEGHNHDFETFLSVSDLHTDTWDGGGEMGSCTVHTCRRVKDTVSHVGDPREERQRLRLRGLACFPTAEGGRGVHIASMVPGWHCAILMQTANRLHGSVVACESVPYGPPSVYSRAHGNLPDAALGLGVQSTSLTARADPLLMGGCSLPSMQMMRVVTYPLKRIETLLERLARDPCKEEDLLNASHPWIVQPAGLSD